MFENVLEEEFQRTNLKFVRVMFFKMVATDSVLGCIGYGTSVYFIVSGNEPSQFASFQVIYYFNSTVLQIYFLFKAKSNWLLIKNQQFERTFYFLAGN